MNEALQHFFAVMIGTILDVLPIAGILIGFQFLVLRRPIKNPKEVLFGFLLVLIGLVLFLEGLDLALFPLGELMANQLTSPEILNIPTTAGTVQWHHYFWVYLFAASIGFSTTIAEPSLIAVAIKANQVSAGAISQWGLRIAVAIGAAVGVSLGCYRIISGTPLHWYIMAGYVVVIVQTVYAPRSIIALAYDSGGVTTSTVTVPLVAALGLGLSSNIPGRNPVMDGFGLIAFTCLFPIMSVMAYAQLSEWRSKRKTDDTTR
ncbi:MAG: DUF1538 domain-containing protein [Candidatus Thiodiazotropha sp. (ex Lucina aurantia)]|nr:DUF1538 domain-containing protein [Candidatus Thiodiazotropha sp. (ex Lucina pensylvanica)]MBT3022349.1 DUF1538 domain-containing protein [Candidatus Thiodiazotropha taylori]MBV2097572.1 DUF1538 domain-containing protein [Candidatus Thiodiazotropha sp. (ex Codakia orbicularis)]MBV2102054.1 DUF1538 domain-containing protein [Candidatus Thiodiazotropha sp. (ex Lucina aurantia)]MBV2116966.1 DUF1538 domain-containing protein [Candidatus Thiodiazotropha sp. (ex Lucina aurantia)]